MIYMLLWKLIILKQYKTFIYLLVFTIMILFYLFHLCMYLFIYLWIYLGIDVTANQFMEVSDTEIFQIGYHRDMKDKTTFLSKSNKYWTADEKSITIKETNVSPSCVFELEWHENKVALKASNGKYVTSTTGGRLAPTSSNTSDPAALFTLTLVNRPLLLLRGQYGYIGEVQQTNKVQCNRGLPNIVQLLHEFDGKYRLKSVSGKFWQIDSDGFVVFEDSDEEYFYLELNGKNSLVVRTGDGRLLSGDKNGTIMAKAESVNKNNTWEY